MYFLFEVSFHFFLTNKVLTQDYRGVRLLLIDAVEMLWLMAWVLQRLTWRATVTATTLAAAVVIPE